MMSALSAGAIPLSVLGLLLVGGALGLYFAYSQSVIGAPRLAAGLQPLLGWPRRVALIAGALLALTGVMQGADGPSVTAGLAAALGLRHAIRRQWAFGLAARTAPGPFLDAPPDTAVVTLPTGESLPVQWLHEVRLVRVGDVLLIGCALAGSVAAFRVPGSPVLVLFPLDVGFAVGASARWSGVSGESLDGGAALEPVDLRWENAETANRLLGPPRLGAPWRRTVRISGAQDADPTDVGLVAAGRWSADRCDPSVDPPRRFLARWAARQSKLPGS
jgi:hypothetical protein